MVEEGIAYTEPNVREVCVMLRLPIAMGRDIPFRDSTRSRVRRILHRTEALRCLMMVLGGLGLGIASSAWLFPRLEPLELEALLQAHIPQKTQASLSLLRLWLSRLPFLCLLGAAAFTRFSGFLTSCLLTVRGVSGGLVLGILFRLVTQNQMPLGMTEVMMWRWLGAYLLWCMTELTAELVLAAEARNVARGEAWPRDLCLKPDPVWRDRLLLYGATALTALCLSLGGCILYLVTFFI